MVNTENTGTKKAEVAPCEAPGWNRLFVALFALGDRSLYPLINTHYGVQLRTHSTECRLIDRRDFNWRQ